MALITEKNTPRWIIFLIDLGISFGSIILAYLLRFNFSIPELEMLEFWRMLPIFMGVRAVSFLIGRTYAGIVRYTGTEDAQRIFTVLFAGSALFALSNVFRFYMFDERFLIPYSIIIIDFMNTMVLMIGFRIGIKVLFAELTNSKKESTNVVIYGAGNTGIITKHTLDRDRGSKYKVVAFVDRNASMIGKKMEGVLIQSANDLTKIFEDVKVKHLIIAVPEMDAHAKKDIIEKCLHYSVNILDVPPVTKWINGELSFKQIKKIKIDDLLERDPIRLDVDVIQKDLKGKVILVTGAAGSIGSEIVRQALRFSPKKVVLLDQAESALYDFEFELKQSFDPKLFEVVIGDIRHEQRIENVFNTFSPQIVFHTAAYKHVPLMEENPSEAIRTNIMGSKILADLAHKFGVEKFVMVSTDKAVNPTNVMGASKRAAEIYVQSLNSVSKTKFITTRFGNVLGSNGSVIPLFRKQIEKGGPITVTHPEITRYFMTIPEACQLVLEAGTLGEGGEIFIFDMGKSVKIIDLAKKMVKLSGLELGKDIQIQFTGLRPGEKLYEELLADKENTIATHHPQIMIAKVRSYSFDTVKGTIADIISLYETQDNQRIVTELKKLIPEYISNNSEFEKLDQKVVQ